MGSDPFKNHKVFSYAIEYSSSSSDEMEAEEPTSQVPQVQESQVACMAVAEAQQVACMAVAEAQPSTTRNPTTETPEQLWLNVLGGLALLTSPVVAMREHCSSIQKDLSNIDSSGNVSEGLAFSLVNSLDSLLGYVDVMDNAVDFHKIGGFDLLHPLLQVPHPGVKARALELVAELVQNNPYCQSKAIEYNLLPVLFDIFEKDMDDTVSVKAMYAISCLCRQNPSILDPLIEVDGIQKLLHSLQRQSERIQTKVTFLLTHLIEQLPEIRDVLFDLQAAKILVYLLHDEFKPGFEYILGALLALLSNHERSRKQCVDPELCLKDCVMTHLAFVRDKPEYLEAEGYLSTLLSFCDPDDMPSNVEMKSADEMER